MVGMSSSVALYSVTLLAGVELEPRVVAIVVECQVDRGLSLWFDVSLTFVGDFEEPFTI
jgi:hypothetical protein